MHGHKVKYHTAGNKLKNFLQNNTWLNYSKLIIYYNSYKIVFSFVKYKDFITLETKYFRIWNVFEIFLILHLLECAFEENAMI